MTKPSAVLVTGSLAAYAAGYCAELAAKHYTPLSAANLVRVMAHLSRWLSSKRLRPSELSVERLERFLRHRRRTGHTAHGRSLRGLEPLLAYLRRLNVIPNPAPPSQTTFLEQLIAEYVEYLRTERALAETTIQYRHVVARNLLACSADGDEWSPDSLNAQCVRNFVIKAIRGCSVGAAGGLATAVRSLLRFLHVRNYISAPLVGAVPKIAGWRQTSLPRAIEPDYVNRLLAACDRRTAVGRRDYAIVVVLVRLGLRAGEIAALRLEDLDWRRGEIIIHGKGHRVDRLPLPADVGEVVAAYLRRGRPACETRTVVVGEQDPRKFGGQSGLGVAA